MLYRQGAIGGGDLKLFAGIGAILQTTLGVEAEMYSFFGAALFAPAILAYQGKLIVTLKNSVAILVNMFLPKEKRRPVEENRPFVASARTCRVLRSRVDCLPTLVIGIRAFRRLRHEARLESQLRGELIARSWRTMLLRRLFLGSCRTPRARGVREAP